MRIVIINGANLNLLGTREVEIYGKVSFEEYLQKLRSFFSDIEIYYYQSNVEGEIINYLQQEGFVADGIILNPGGYTHTSVAIGDCIAAIKAPVIEVHITNINAREEFRKISYVSAKCLGTITGLGLEGYYLAIQYFVNKP